MAKRGKNTRIEPTFDAPTRRKSNGDMRVTADDRAVATHAKRNAAKKPAKAGSARRKQTKRKQTRKRGGLFGFIGKSIYWCPYIPMAVIAVEDRRYKSHFGFDPIGFTRAMVRNVMAQRLVEGGSTITQQLAKNLFLEPSRTIERKVQELIIALWLESKYDKDEILELYLNRVYFGSGAYGVDAASRRYFSKSARDVNLAEAALLAGLLKAPSRLSPAKNPELAEESKTLLEWF